VVRLALDLRRVVVLRRDRVDVFLPRRRRDCPDSDMAMAIACRRLFTLPRRPRPLLSWPRLYSCITLFTLRLCRDDAITFLRFQPYLQKRNDVAQMTFRRRFVRAEARRISMGLRISP
jgi:hypothetical protein